MSTAILNPVCSDEINFMLSHDLGDCYLNLILLPCKHRNNKWFFRWLRYWWIHFLSCDRRLKCLTWLSSYKCVLACGVLWQVTQTGNTNDNLTTSVKLFFYIMHYFTHKTEMWYLHTASNVLSIAHISHFGIWMN